MAMGGAMDSCGRCMKMSLVAINVLTFLGGALAMAIGVWIWVSRSFSSTLLSNNMFIASVAVVVAMGAAVMILSLLGCCGAAKEVKCMLLTYYILVFIIFVVMLVGGILLFGEYQGEKYRYLVLERYGKDVWSLFKEASRTFSSSTVFQLGLQMLDVLEYIHSRGYVHADIKGANILMGLKKGTENQAYLVDFGLATRVTDKEFKPDPKCAHNGTIEYTSRDAHLGVATMRGDLEILGYNMLQWLVGVLPWEKNLKQPKTVQAMKEAFMNNVRKEVTRQFKNVPEALINFFEYINSMKPKDAIDYTKCRQIFDSYLNTEGVTRSKKLDFTANKKRNTKKVDNSIDLIDNDENPGKVLKRNTTKQNGDVKVVKRGRRAKVLEEEDCENKEPDERIVKPSTKTRKRKSIEPSMVVKVRRPKMAPEATPPTKKNHTNIATQTSIEKPKRSPRQVSFDSPISEIIGEKNLKRKSDSINTSGDIFDDSFEIEEKKVKPRRKLLSDEEVTVKRVVRKKVTSVKPKGRSWKDSPAVMNGRSPPK